MEEERERFHYNFWFCVGLVVIGIIAILAIIFCTIPKQNEQLANVAFGFFSGSLVTAAVQFLLGGNPAIQNKKISSSITPSQIPEEKTDNNQK